MPERTEGRPIDALNVPLRIAGLKRGRRTLCVDNLTRRQLERAVLALVREFGCQIEEANKKTPAPSKGSGGSPAPE